MKNIDLVEPKDILMEDLRRGCVSPPNETEGSWHIDQDFLSLNDLKNMAEQAAMETNEYL